MQRQTLLPCVQTQVRSCTHNIRRKLLRYLSLLFSRDAPNPIPVSGIGILTISGKISVRFCFLALRSCCYVLNQIHRSLNIFLFLQPPWRQPCVAQALSPHCSPWALWPASRPLLRFIQILAWLWRKWGGSYRRRPTTWASRSLQMWERSSEKGLSYPLLNCVYLQKVAMHRYR